ncbi:hypothetical protein C8Q75DRAFT_754817 [Abortiporus biennis]|nr:hypothetical protein C8Q75DRAFT_754817 [Abortiporus biennis]
MSYSLWIMSFVRGNVTNERSQRIRAKLLSQEKASPPKRRGRENGYVGPNVMFTMLENKPMIFSGHITAFSPPVRKREKTKKQRLDEVSRFAYSFVGKALGTATFFSHPLYLL